MLSLGPVATSILAKLGVSEAGQPGFLQTIADLIPAGPVGEVDELARAALFLACDRSSFVKGATLHVHGGMSLG